MGGIVLLLAAAALTMYADVAKMKESYTTLQGLTLDSYTQRHAAKLERRVYRLESKSCFTKGG